MDYAAIGFAILGLGFGLSAAFYWFQSAQVKVGPGWKTQLDEPVELTDKNSDWITGLLEWSDKAAALNARAAILTACALVFGTIASVLGSLTAFR